MVIFTDSAREELAEIEARVGTATRRFYVYSDECAGEMDYFRLMLPDFRFVALKQTCSPQNSDLFVGNGPDDFIVLKKPRLGHIMDRNIEMFQIVLKGRKLVVDDHPFLGKSETFWCYFPYSFFDKSLLGYPHSYAFRDAKIIEGLPNPFDGEYLAACVASATKTYKNILFADEPQTICVTLSKSEHALYRARKDQLFDQEKLGPRQIVRALKNYVDATPTVRSATRCERLNLLDLNRVWKQWKTGVRVRVVSDARVDVFLAGEMDAYFAAANGFLGALGANQL